MGDIVNTRDPGDPTAVEQPASDVPEKYRDKSQAELVRELEGLQKRFDHQGNEVGQLRRLVEQATMQQPQAPAGPPEDFDPYEPSNIEQLIDRKIAPLIQAHQQGAEIAFKNRMDNEHPGWQEIASAKDFQDWVAESQVRVQLFQNANGADFKSASELLNTWNEVTATKAATDFEREDAVKQDRQLRAATTEKGSRGIDGRKTLKRADLIELKRTNPERYEALADDILDAYRQGRVK